MAARKNNPHPALPLRGGGSIKLAVAQIDVTVGDIAGNAEKILAAHARAQKLNADLVVFPELALVGYTPEDLLLMPAFRRQAMETLKKLAKKTARGPAMIVGSLYEGDPHPSPLPKRERGQKSLRSSPSPFQGEGRGEGVYNTAILLAGGKIAHVQPKTALPNYGVFDERRWFTPGPGPKAVRFKGKKIGLLVCEDVWHPELAASLKKQGAELLIVINASPFAAGKLKDRKKVAAATKLPILYVNMVGGQDDIVFDGGSFMLSAQGKTVAQLPEFEEGVFILPTKTATLSTEETLWEAMKLGLRDYVEKNNFGGVVLGLSGGIDSALTAAVSVEALGTERVHGVLLPSPYSSKGSIEDAHETARLLSIDTSTVPITPGMQIFEEVLNPVFRDAGWMENVGIGGNVQSRLRGMMLMAMSNRFGWMLLSTGNKSEIAVGYTTLYGDMCGGYNVIKDLYKTQVYQLARWRNARGCVIPERSITKPPSAELAPGQKDEDQLPPYELLDKILYLHIERRKSAAEIVALGFDAEVVEKTVQMVRVSEYKRRQSCPGVRLSPMLFSKDRRYPLTNGWKL